MSNVVRIARIAMGKEPEDFPADDSKDKAARALGKTGWADRAKSMTPKRQAEIAPKAAEKRWAK